jgi:hypothetical protein
MFRISRRKPWPPQIDLDTVRETILYIESDMARVPGLEGVAAALKTAVREIDRARPPMALPSERQAIAPRFIARRA